MKKAKSNVRVKATGKVSRPSVWTCPGCEITYTLTPDLFGDQVGAELCKDCLRENELLARLGPIKKAPSNS